MLTKPSRKYLIHILQDILPWNLIENLIADNVHAREMVPWLQRKDVSQEIIDLVVLAIEQSRNSRLQGAINEMTWQKLIDECNFKSIGGEWLAEILQTSFEEVSFAINGMGDFKRRGYEIYAETEMIGKEFLLAHQESWAVLGKYAYDHDSPRARLQCLTEMKRYDDIQGRMSMYIYIFSGLFPGNGTNNWFYAEMLMPEEKLLFYRISNELSGQQ